MRTRPQVLTRPRSALLLACLAVGIAGCNLFKEKSDDSAPPAAPERPAAAAPAAPTTAVYTVNRPSDGDPDVVIEKVTVTPTETRVEMSFTNKDKKPSGMMLAPVGDPEVMFLESGGKKIALLRATGIATMPQSTEVGPGETKRFTIVFEPLPAGATSFDLYEGEQGKTAKIGGGANLWVFRNVLLR